MAAGVTSPHVGYFGDWFATAVELAKATLPDGLDSVSMVRELLGHHDQQRQHEYLYWEFHERGFSQAVLYQGRWKGIRQQKASAPLRLFDLQNDIGEKTDVADQHPELVQQLTLWLQTARRDSPDWPAKDR